MSESPCGSDRRPPTRAAVLGWVRWLAAAVLLAATLAGEDAVTAPGEYQIKAAFLFNFAKFTGWPASDSVLTVCVLGDDPFGAALDEAVAGKTIHGRTISVRRLANPKEAGSDCQVLFIAASESSRLRAVLRELDGKPVLTVGDMPRAARLGTAIGFFTHNNRVRFEINPEAAARAGLKFSSQLLRLAVLVKGET
jgi:hypothetical protein